MKNGIIILMTLSLLVGGSLASAEEELAFTVIVHATNQVAQISKQELSQFFLKKVKHWKDSDAEVLPVDLVDTLPVRERFSEAVHNRDIASIKAYWQKQIFSGRGVPPEEKKSEAEVLQYISDNPGAIGYISGGTPIDEYENVKVVDIVDAK